MSLKEMVLKAVTENVHFETEVNGCKVSCSDKVVRISYRDIEMYKLTLNLNNDFEGNYYGRIDLTTCATGWKVDGYVVLLGDDPYGEITSSTCERINDLTARTRKKEGTCHDISRFPEILKTTIDRTCVDLAPVEMFGLEIKSNGTRLEVKSLEKNKTFYISFGLVFEEDDTEMVLVAQAWGDDGTGIKLESDLTPPLSNMVDTVRSLMDTFNARLK